MALKKLGDHSHDFIQTLIKQFILTRDFDDIHKITLHLNLPDELDTIRNIEEKRALHDQLQNQPHAKELLQKDLSEFKESTTILSKLIQCEHFPLRYANGGVLPILHMKNTQTNTYTDYVCLFLRCVFPAGWNIANGSSNTVADLMNPEAVMLREFQEELLFIQHNNSDNSNVRYALFNDSEGFSSGTLQKSLLQLESEFPGISSSYHIQPLPVKWISGNHSIVIKRNNTSAQYNNVFINITPDDNAIEIDRIGLIHIDDQTVLLDGEVIEQDDKDPVLIHRIIGLFELQSLLNADTNTREYKPDIVFYRGKKRNPDELESILSSEYLPYHRHKQIRFKHHDDYYEKQDYKFDLCPITKALVSVYKESCELAVANVLQANSYSSPNITESAKKKFTLFISYKTADQDVAFLLYDYLKLNGYEPFCSGKSIPILGESDYAKQIDTALDTSQSLIVVARKAEYMFSGWVNYEWSSFFNEIRSGRKQSCKLFTCTQNVAVDDMPYPLRSQQNIPISNAQYLDAFKLIVTFLGK